MNRNRFLKMTAFPLLASLGGGFLEKAAAGMNNFLPGDDILKRLSAANDKQVTGLLQSIQPGNISFSRKIGYDFSFLAAAYCYPGSMFYHSNLIVPKLEILTKALLQHQTEDGTVNIGNLESPPDTAFLIELLTAGALLLGKDKSKELTNTREDIKKFIVKAGKALTTGGVHTPNHRWVVCAALARIHHLYPDKKYVDRIEEWLGEGIYMDEDGHYPERSVLYANVENTSLLTMGLLLNKPSLFEPVRKNLKMTYYYMEPNGDLVVMDSRRQDIYEGKSVIGYYLHYRFFALLDNDAHFAGIAKAIEGMKGFEEGFLNRGLFQFLEISLLQKELPQGNTPPDNYEKLFTTSGLLRIRRRNVTSTLFGGVDWPLIIASGRSSSPNFFSFRKGNAILKYIRLSSSFFSTGYFYSDGLKKEGSKYILHKELQVPYYQPLPAHLRNKEGDYKLSPSTDGRFWNKMDFENRPASNIKTLDTKIGFSETGTGNELLIEVTGLAGVRITIELCFGEGGKLSGVTPGENDNNFLETGMGKYEYGDDTITFGPGAVTHKTINNLEGERYSTHFGSLRTKGMHVYLTGVTPFTHKLVFS